MSPELEILVSRRRRSRNDRHPLPARDGDSEMPNIFAVVGEHREKSDHLLVLGEDGSYYDYALITGQTLPVEPDQSWKTDERCLIWTKFWNSRRPRRCF